MRSGFARAALSATAAITILAACTGQPTAPKRPSATAVQFERMAINSVLRAGFTEIRDKGFVERSTADLFIAGLRNISKLDPELRFAAEDGQLILSLQGAVNMPPQPILNVIRPDDDDLQGWVNVAIVMYEAARRASMLAVQTEREDLYQFMFDGALTQIDPYSRYSGNHNVSLNRANRNGFIGIGIEYDMRMDGAYVSSVAENGPAGHAGLQTGDVISAVDGKELTGLSREAVRRLIAGPTDTTVRLTVMRAETGEKLSLSVRRSLIVPHTVQWTMTGNGVAVIRVHSFNIRTSADVSQAVAAIKDSSGNTVKGYVLDLRGDPGGLLDQAVDLSDLFLDSGS
ncbi:MAG: PDZ domain-containing protein, partial [Rhodospirillaceae bacterium]|nr:PDZ domain-containing protein [Rhodospirillaceae bacterium]